MRTEKVKSMVDTRLLERMVEANQVDDKTKKIATLKETIDKQAKTVRNLQKAQELARVKISESQTLLTKKDHEIKKLVFDAKKQT